MLAYCRSFIKNHGRWLPIHEAILVVLLLYVFNNFLKYNERVIQADGLGYYTYLPATFIYKDLNFKFADTLQTELYNLKDEHGGFIRNVNNRGVNKYFIGTAIMQTPFFLVAHACAMSSQSLIADGYSGIYQRAIFIAAIFWTIVGLYFLRLTMLRLTVHSWWVFWIQLAVLMASSIPNYIAVDPSFSHVYSFGAISVWCFLIVGYDPEKPFTLFWIALILGLIVLIRPINILILLFIPFLLLIAGKKPYNLLDFFRNRGVFLFALFIFACVVFFQTLVWYIQTGHWFVRSYGDESFNFSNPHIFDFLFSYRKGFFVYAPIFFVFLLCSSFVWIKRKKWSDLVSFYAAFIALVFVLSSWWYWSYGFSFGSRVMIDFYPLFALVSVPFFLKSNVILKWLSIPIICFAGYLVLIQTYQYKNYILSWDGMTKEGYWTVFLKTDLKYQGYLWQEKLNPKELKSELFCNRTTTIQDMYEGAFTAAISIDEVYSKLAIQIKGNCSYSKGISRFMISIDDSLGANYYYNEIPIFKVTAKEAYSGTFDMVFNIPALQTGSYQLVFFVYRDEEMICNKPFDLRLFGFPKHTD